MRIVELVNSLEIGGAEVMAADLAMELARRGHSVSFACLRGSGPLAARLETAGVEVVAFGKQDGFSPRVARALADYLSGKRAEVVHTHNPLVHHYGLLASRLAHVPALVNTLHGPANVRRFAPATLLFDVSCLFSDRVVSCCAAVGRRLKSATVIAARKSVVIPNGIHVEAFRGPADRRDDGAIIFGTVGRLAEVKDHRSLLQAFAEVTKRRSGCRLEILGDGPLRKELEQLAARLGISERVRFLGAGLDVGGFLSRIDAFVLSSLSEGLPMTVLEAMASSLPVISTAVGAVPELVQQSECGWIAAPGKPDELASAMLAAANAPALKKYGARARSYVEREYSTCVMASGYEELFKRVLYPSIGN